MDDGPSPSGTPAGDRRDAPERPEHRLSTRPGDGSLSRVDAVKDERVRRWDVVSPSATLIGRPERPEWDVDETLRRLHDEHHPAMAGHSERMHRLDKLRITHAFCNRLGLTPWERDRALGIVAELDFRAFGSQRAVPTVALVVIAYVGDRERRRRLGLHDTEWVQSHEPDELESLYDRYRSMTDDPEFSSLLEQQGLDVTAVNRLTRTLREQLDAQDLHGAALSRSPHRDPSLPPLRESDDSRPAAAGGSDAAE